LSIEGINGGMPVQAGEAIMPFRDREQAGKALAAALKELAGEEVIVLAIPRGGVVVGSEVAKSLGAPLDVIITRKIGAPGEPEFAVGAVTQNGEVIVDEAAVEVLHLTHEYIDKEAESQWEEVKDRMNRFRGDRPLPSLKGKVVVIVDDGIATGNTVFAALKSVKMQGAKSVIVAAPVGPRETIAKLATEADKVVCLETPEPFFAIGQFYTDFRQVEDDEVRRILDAQGIGSKRTASVSR
jgi:putative phosphoribosyl transferase